MAPTRKNFWNIACGLLILLFGTIFATSAAGFPKENELLDNPQKVFECTTCHNPHEMPKFALKSQCQSCHTKEKSGFATHIYPMYLLALFPLIFMVLGIWSRYRLWRLGGKANRLDQIPRRIAGVLIEVFGYRRLSRDTYSGLMHLFIFYGFLAELIATGLLATQDGRASPFSRGTSISGTPSCPTASGCWPSSGSEWPSGGASSCAPRISIR